MASEQASADHGSNWRHPAQDAEQQVLARFRAWSYGSGLAAALLGAAVLGGWWLGWHWLTNPLHRVPMKSITAASLVLLGIAVMLLRRPEGPRQRVTRKVLASVTLLIGAATLAQYATRWDLR